MNADYMTSAAALPPHIPYPRFLLTMDMKLIDRVVYAILLDEATRAQEKGWVDKHGRLYVALPTANIAQAIDRTSPTVRNAINALEEMGLVERRLTSHTTERTVHILRLALECVNLQQWVSFPGQQKTGQRKEKSPSGASVRYLINAPGCADAFSAIAPAV